MALNFDTSPMGRMRSYLSEKYGKVVRNVRKAGINRRERYIFTDKTHPEKGIFSAGMGVISVISISYGIYLSFLADGNASVNATLGVGMTGVIAIVGLIFGIISRRERDIFKLFPNLGIILNGLCLLSLVAMTIIGIYF